MAHNQHITAPDYYGDKLHLMITEEIKVRFMTLEPMAEDEESLKSTQ